MYLNILFSLCSNDYCDIVTFTHAHKFIFKVEGRMKTSRFHVE